MRANFALDYTTIPAGEARKLYLMAFLSAGPAPKDRTRKALNLSLVIDRSGSMAGDKIDYTRQAAQMLVQNLGVRDILSIVLYNDAVETLLMPEKVQRKDAINQQIMTIKPGGTTNLSGGWLEGCRLVDLHKEPESLNRVILMSDGLANRGVTSQEKLVQMAKQKLDDEGISTTTMGLGTDFAEDLMMEMANAGGGAFYFIESPEVAPVIFQEELQGLLSLVGQNLNIKVEQTSKVSSLRQLNMYPVQKNQNVTTYRLGDVFGDELKALVIELSIPAISDVGEAEIAKLEIEFDEINDHGVQHRTWNFPIRVTVAEPSDERPQAVNMEVRRAVILLKAAQARRSAIDMADRGHFNEASRILKEMVKEIDNSGLAATDDQIREEREALEQQAIEIEGGAARYQEYGRKTMSTQAFYTMTSRHDETMVLRFREAERRDKEKMAAFQTEQASQEEIEKVLPTGIPPTRYLYDNEIHELSGELVRIGRSTSNDLVVSVKGVSRHHCQIRNSGGKWILDDLGSTNGTAVNGKFIKQSYTLAVGDVVELCDEKIVMLGDDAEDEGDTSEHEPVNDNSAESKSESGTS